MTAADRVDAALARLAELLDVMAPDPVPTDVDLAALAPAELRERVATGELSWERVWADPGAVPGGVALVRAALRHRSGHP